MMPWLLTSQHKIAKIELNWTSLSTSNSLHRGITSTISATATATASYWNDIYTLRCDKKCSRVHVAAKEIDFEHFLESSDAG
jgi:hypothetical protein